MSAFDFILHAGEGRRFKKIVDLARSVNDWEPKIEPLSDGELAAKTEEFRRRLADGETLDDLLPEAYATVREGARRSIGQRHFDVQVVGAAVLHKGAIAEMKTGEGKTLVATMPAYLNALAGKGVHVATVNPYLAKRDAEWMGQVHRLLGMSVGLIQPDMTMSVRRQNYNCDITYGTNNEFGFDYLRDNMAMRLEDCSQRGHHFAIVDEVDSILIDEARTPLIISGTSDEAARWYRTFARLVQRLKAEEHYEVDEAKRTVAVTEEGIARVEQLLGIENLYDEVSTPLVHYLDSALKAKELYKRDRDYIVQNREVLIVDEFTGRTLPGRRWSDGLHQAVEAKESVPIQQESQTYATITIQNYFRLYDKLAGMTGTAKTQATEFANVYNLEVYEVPTNRPMVRKDEPDSIYKSEDAKWKAVTEDVVRRHEEGQPVLVGTISIEKSERLAGYLERRGVPHHVLNAKHHEKEAYIVAQAGRTGAVTLATNMAGRGVDILLGGNAEYLARAEMSARGFDNDAYLLERLSPEDKAAYEDAYEPILTEKKAECAEEHERVVDKGGLYILGTERHESRRIDNQLRGRAGRQGDPGETRFYLSLDDDLMRFFATGMISSVMERLNLPEDMPIESKMVSKAIERAQSQVEAQNYELRKNVLKYDEVMNKQREVIYEQRHQLLEGVDLSDKVFDFIGEAVEGWIGTYANADAHSEDWDWEGLENTMAQLYPSKLIGSFDRENTSYSDLVAAYIDEAMDHYQQREEEIGRSALPKFLADARAEFSLHDPGTGKVSGSLELALTRSTGSAADRLAHYYEILGVEPEASEEEIRAAYHSLAMLTHPDVNPAPDAKERFQVISAAYTVVLRAEKEEVAAALGEAAANGQGLAGVEDEVDLPVEDLEVDEAGVDAADVLVSSLGKRRMRELERIVLISILDNKWREHLYEMDYLREGIGLRGYGQRDPEIEYKREGYDMFQAMMASAKEEFVRYMFHVQLVEEVPEPAPTPVVATREDGAAKPAPAVGSGTPALPAGPSSGNGAAKGLAVPARATVGAGVAGGPGVPGAELNFDKVGRNAPCPCGSGRKFKKCHGAEL